MKLPAARFEYKKCSPPHLADMLEMQREALESMQKGDLRKNSKAALEECLYPPHITLGAFFEETLCAFCVLYFAGTGKESLGRDLGLPEDELKKTANIKLVIVRQKFRGNGLQAALMQRLEKEAGLAGINALCATVSPNNPASIRNLEACGFTFTKELEKYGGLTRRLYFKNLRGE